jgi:hypothetical protein
MRTMLVLISLAFGFQIAFAHAGDSNSQSYTPRNQEVATSYCICQLPQGQGSCYVPGTINRVNCFCKGANGLINGYTRDCFH